MRTSSYSQQESSFHYILHRIVFVNSLKRPVGAILVQLAQLEPDVRNLTVVWAFHTFPPWTNLFSSIFRFMDNWGMDTHTNWTCHLHPPRNQRLWREALWPRHPSCSTLAQRWGSRWWTPISLPTCCPSAGWSASLWGGPGWSPGGRLETPGLSRHKHGNCSQVGRSWPYGKKPTPKLWQSTPIKSATPKACIEKDYRKVSQAYRATMGVSLPQMWLFQNEPPALGTKEQNTPYTAVLAPSGFCPHTFEKLLGGARAPRILQLA